MTSAVAPRAAEGTISIVLADDRHVVGPGPRPVLDPGDGFPLVAEVADTDATLRSVLGPGPSVLVLELHDD
jgi:hypothetical protein